MEKFESFSQEFGCTLSFVYKTLHREFESKMKKQLKLSQAEIRVIIELAKTEVMRDVKELKQVELANLLGVRPISMSRLIEKMENKGILIRRPSENDKRVKYVSLREDSKFVSDATTSMENNGEKIINKALEGFSSDEKNEFLRLIKKMKDCVIKNFL